MAADDDGPDSYRPVERELCRIPEVTAARIVADAGGRPVEVHILASPAKQAKQIVRDVQSVAMASFGLDLDRRIISVVQLESVGVGGPVRAEPAVAAPAWDDEQEVPPSLGPRSNGHHDLASRVVLDGVTSLRHGPRCSAQVSLRRDADVSVGVADGLLVPGSSLRLVASATINALRELEPAADRADIETAAVVALGGRHVALVSLIFVVPPYEEVVSGSAIVRTAGEEDAMARAVLDAADRRLHRLGRL
jgi:hypothetical protein